MAEADCCNVDSRWVGSGIGIFLATMRWRLWQAVWVMRLRDEYLLMNWSRGDGWPLWKAGGVGRCWLWLVAGWFFGWNALVAQEWRALAAIPDKEGFAGPFAGTDGGQLLVAGGANFPEAKPWDGGTKVWYDQVWALNELGGEWKRAGKLPQPLGYGVSISTPEGLICLGGSDAMRHHRGVFRLTLDEGGQVKIASLPDLPKPCANFCGALVGRTIYVAGGIETVDATKAMHTLWALDLEDIKGGWKEEAPWPGPERMLAAAGALAGSFYLVGGTALKKGKDGKAERVWLRDGYRFTPGKGWEVLGELPQAAVAAPSPLPVMGQGEMWLIGGDDGTQAMTPPNEHVGFPRGIWGFQTATQSWRRVGELPVGLVTTTAVIWKGQLVVPGGEVRPGIRSTEVWAYPLR